MADQPTFVTTDPNKSAMDYAEHDKTYNLFLGMTKWGTISMIVLLVLMAIFLV